MSSRLVRLYPAPWRARYGEEFEALLESRRLTPLDALDVVRGALDARLQPRHLGDRPPNPTRALRVGGAAAVLAGILWPGGLALQALGEAWLGIGIAAHVLGTLALLVALIALSSAQATGRQALVWAAAVIPMLGCLAILGALVTPFAFDPLLGDGDGWEIWFIGVLTTLVGSALFAIAAFRVGRLSRHGAALLAFGAALLPIAGSVVWTGMAPAPFAVLPFLGLPCVGLGWALIGLSAFRLDQEGAAQATT